MKVLNEVSDERDFLNYFLGKS